jgi:hypothetical protein
VEVVATAADCVAADLAHAADAAAIAAAKTTQERERSLTKAVKLLNDGDL